jgi:hypothetical protein
VHCAAAHSEYITFRKSRTYTCVSFLGGGELWVDKYAPKSFTQLLSPEKINREVLKALKKWDRFVFKSEHHQPGRVRHCFARALCT